MTSFGHYTLVQIGAGAERVDLETASRLTGMHREMIQEFARARLVPGISKAEDDTVYLDDRAVRRLRQIEDLRVRQHVNLRTIRLIVHLMNRLEEAEVEIRTLRELAR